MPSTPFSQLIFIKHGNTTDEAIDYVNSSDTTVTDWATGGPSGTNTGLTAPIDIKADLPGGFYYIIDPEFTSGTADGQIRLGFTATPTVAPTSVYSVPDPAPPNAFGEAHALAIDTTNHILYLAQTAYSNSLSSLRPETGIVSFSYNPTTGALTGPNNILTRSAAGSQQTDATLVEIRAVSLDTTHHVLYFTDDSFGKGSVVGVTPTNVLKAYDTVTHVETTVVAFPSGTDNNVEYPTPYTNGTIYAVTADPTDNLVFFSTASGFGGSEALNKIYVITSAGTGQLQLTEAAAYDSLAPFNMTFDDVHNQLYVSYEPTGSVNHLGALVRYDVNIPTPGSTTGITLSNPVSFDLSLDNSPPTTGTYPYGQFLDQLPALTTSGTTTHAAEQDPTKINLLTAPPTITDSDNDHLASATVQITGGTFASNETSANDDHLTVLDGVTSKTSGTFTGTNITIAYDSATEKLTLTGYDTLANYATVLSHVQYNTTGDNPTNYGSNNTRTVTWQTNDGALNNPSGTNTTTTTLTIDAQNDAPNVFVGGGNSASIAVNETNSGLSGTRSLSIADPDSLTETLTLTNFSEVGPTNGITNATLQGFFLVPSSVNITQATGSASFNWTFNSGAEAFNFLGAGQTLTLNYNIHDVDSNNSNGPGSAALSDDQAISVVITGVNDAPVVTAGQTLSYTENQAATAISPAANVTDIDSPDFNGGSLTVAFTANGAAQDQLSIVTDATVTVSAGVVSVGGSAVGTVSGGVNGAALVVTFNSANATPAAITTLMEHIGYFNNSDNPSTLARTVSFTVNDGDGTANSGTNTGTATATINVTAVNDPPVNNKPGAQIVNEDTALVFNAAHSNTITITDPDAQSGNETVTLSVNHGTLTLGSTAGLASNSGNGTGSVTFSGTLANLNNALNGLSYSATANFNGSDTLTITTNDNSNSPTSPNNPLQDQDTVAITVSPVNDAPTVVNGTSVSLVATNEDTPSASVSINSLLSTHFSDALDDQLANGGSAPNNFAGIAVTANAATAGQGTWEYSTNGGGSWSPIPDVSGANDFLIASTDQIRFEPAADFNGTPGSLTVHLVDDSAGAITTGTIPNIAAFGTTTPYSSGTITIGESVNSVNDAPAFTALDGTPAFTEGGASVPLDSDASVNDTELDALNAGAGNYAGATLTLARDGGANAQDVFSFVGGAFTVSGNALQSGGQTFATFTNTGGTLAISFTSSGTIATTLRVNDVLDHINYANNSDAPPAQVQIDYTLNDGNSGSQGAGGALTASGFATVAITPTNDAPDVTPNSPTAVTYVLTQANPVGLLSNGQVTDPDQPANFADGDLTIAITANNDPGNDHIVLLTTSPFTVGGGGALMDGGTQIGTIAGLGTDTVSVTALTTDATPAEIDKLLEAFGFSSSSTQTNDRSVTFTFDDGGNVGGSAPGLQDAVTQTVHVAQPTNGQLYFRINNGPDDQVGHINADGSDRATLYATATNETSIAIDTAAGFVFTAGVGAHSTFDAVSVHNLATGAFVTKHIFGADTGVGATDDVVQSLAIDPTTHTLYVSDRSLTTSTTGIKTLSYDPGTGALTDNGFLFTATDTETTPADATTARFTNAQALYSDYAHHLLYYVDDDAGNSAAASNGVYVFDTAAAVGAANPTQLTDPTQFPAATTPGGVGTAGNLVGLAVDVADGIVFFETTDVANSANNALWWINTTGANQTATQITLPAGVTLNHAGDTGAGGDAAGLTFDPATSQLYLTNAYYSVGPNLGAIYVLQWDNSGHTVSSVTSFDTATLVGAAPSASNAPSVTTFDDAPTLSVTSATPTFTESATNPASANNTPVTLLSGATVGDADGAGNLAGATVSISTGFLTGDLLSVTLTGNITVASNTGGVLTLTGTDTFANYQTVLNSVQYTSTSENPTNYDLDTSRTITWNVTDGLLSNPTPVTTTVAVANTNDAPTNTVPGAQSVAEDTALAFTGGNAISVADVDNQSLSVTVSADHGNVTLGSTTNLTVVLNGTHSVLLSGAIVDINNALATLTYKGDANFNGSDTLTVSTDDGGASTTDNTVAITVSPVDDAPSGSDNSVSTPLNTAYTFAAGVFGFSDATDQVSGGSSANTFAAVKITTLTLPAGATLKDGAATVNASDTISITDINNNQLVFTPAPGAGGANYAHFTFQVVDNGNNTAPNANIDPTPNLMTLNVGSGFGPTAASDTYPVLEANTVTGTAGTGGTGVLHNDSGSSLTITAVNGSGGNVNNSTAGTYGHLTLHDDGSFSYAADQTAVIDAVGSATHPIDTFNYTVTDDQSLSATTTVSFSIDRPPTTATHNVGVVENTSTGTVSANDTDPDGDSLTVTALTGGTVGAAHAGSFGSLTINANDTYSYSANNTSAIDAAPTGSHPTDTFTYTVSDGLGGTALETFDFSIDRAPSAVTDSDPANDSGPAKGAITEGAGSGTTVGITASATDPDGDTLTYSLTTNPGGFFTIDPNTGVVSVGTNGATGIDFETAPGHAYSITVQAADGQGGTSTQSFTIAVNDAAPSAAADSDTGTADAVAEAAPLNTYTGLTASSSDPNGGTIVYSLTDTAGGAFKINSSNGQVLVNDPTAINYESAPGHALTVTVQAATTGGTLVSTHDFSIAITNVNPSTPTDSDGTTNSVTEGAATGTLVNVTASSTDPNGPPVTYSITADQSNGGFKIDSSSGVVSVADATKINYETAPGHAYSITVQASDGAGGTSAQNFSIAVGDVAPVATADTYTGANAANEDQPLNVSAAAGVLANDTDVNGGPLTAVLDVGPNHAASFTLNPDGSFNYTPSANFNGSDSFTYHAFDGSQSSGIVSATITVNPINDAPVLSGFGDTASYTENGSSVLLDVNQNSTVSDIELDASANHYAGATLILARTGGPSPDDTFAGTGSLDLVDVNGNGENVSLDGGATFIGTYIQTSDGTFSITFNSNAHAADINSVMRQIVYANTSDNPPASVQITYTLSDGNGVSGGQDQGAGPTPGIATGSVTVNITQVDDAPALFNVAPTAAYSLGSSGVVLSLGLQVFDPDATPPSPLTGLANATVKIESGFLATDQLFVNLATSGGHFVTPDSDVTNISVLSNAGGTLVVSGNDTVAHYQSVLDAVSYRSTAADPSNGGADPTRNISWQVNDGLLNSQTPNPDPNNLVNETILHFNAPPTLDLDASGAGTGFTTTFTERAPPVAIVDTDVSITDPDNFGLASANIVLTNAKASDVMSIAGTLPGGIDSSIDTSVAGQITVHLFNSASLADYQTALEQIRFANTSVVPNTTDRDITVTVNDGDADSNVAHATVHVINLPSGGTDFNADGYSDLLWQTDANQLAIWEMNGFQISAADYTRLGSSAVGLPGPDWHIVDTGDFDGDGKTDILWRTDSGAAAIWEMDGTHIKTADYTRLGSTAVGAPGADWHLLGAADFDGDGKSDLLWRTDSGALAIWEMDGTHIKATDYIRSGSTAVGVPAPDWKIVGVGDFDGDGKNDLLWETGSGALAVWEMNGTQIKSADYLKIGPTNIGIPNANWHVADVGDFDGDGKADILWRIDDPDPRGAPGPSQVAIWEMNGNQIKAADYTKLGSTNVGAPGPDWHLLGSDDYNGDGMNDLIWRTDSGALAIWEMNGTHISAADYTKIGSTNVGAPGADWHLFQHHYDLV